MGPQLPVFVTFQEKEILVSVFSRKSLLDWLSGWVNPKLVLLLSFMMVGLASFAQTATTVRYVRTEPNGVQVYESIGNEGVLGHDYSVPATTPSIKREVEDFTLVECQDALYHINSKIETVQATQDSPEKTKRLENYAKAKTKVLNRIEVLTSTPH